MSLREGVQAGAENDVLLNAGRREFGDEDVELSVARRDRCAECASPLGIHIAARPPVRIRIRQLQADSVIEHVWSGVEFDVQGTPQRHPHRGAVGWCRRAAHLAGACSFHSRPSGSRTVISLVPQWVAYLGPSISTEAACSNGSASATFITMCLRVGSDSGTSAMNR